MSALRITHRQSHTSSRALIAIVLVGALLRGWAAWRLPVDFDEPVYLEAGFAYADALRAGDWNGVIDSTQNPEHPALVKLLYGLAVLALGRPDWTVALYACRALSALCGTLAVYLLARVDPLAGALLAVHTLAVKYTAQAYLEALPHLASIGAVLALYRSARVDNHRYGRGGVLPPQGAMTAPLQSGVWLSALALGVTAAAKFTYLSMVCVILYLALWEKRLRWRILPYLAVAGLAFWALNPSLWRDPLSRLFNALFFHARYSQSAHVQSSGYPWFQPFVWISRSMPAAWHPEVFFYIGLDEPIFVLALIGLYRTWRERRWVVIWIATHLLFLLAWPTKWPQYALTLVPALCLAAATPVTRFYQWFRRQDAYWGWVRQMVPRPPRAFWILSIGLILALGVGYVAHTLQLTLSQLRWSHLTQGALLPGDTVYDLLAGPDGRMILGTGRGAALWSPPGETGGPESWIVFTTKNSGLPHDRVLAVARDANGVLWFGTESGLGRYDGQGWTTYRALDMGLAQDRVHALAAGSDGRLWVGTEAGAAVYDGQTWTPLTTAPGLPDDVVLALAIDPRPEGDRVWFGTRRGVGRLDTATGAWMAVESLDVEWESVADLLIDTDGQLWAATLGGGLGLWDGEEWRFYRVSNSDLPFNTVQAVYEIEPGVLWVGTALPNEVGGVLATYDGTKWVEYTPRNSGFSGAEPLSIAQDGKGRVWIGTRTGGVDLYTPLGSE